MYSTKLISSPLKVPVSLSELPIRKFWFDHDDLSPQLQERIKALSHERVIFVFDLTQVKRFEKEEDLTKIFSFFTMLQNNARDAEVRIELKKDTQPHYVFKAWQIIDADLMPGVHIVVVD